MEDGVAFIRTRDCISIESQKTVARLTYKRRPFILLISFFPISLIHTSDPCKNSLPSIASCGQNEGSSMTKKKLNFCSSSHLKGHGNNSSSYCSSCRHFPLILDPAFTTRDSRVRHTSHFFSSKAMSVFLQRFEFISPQNSIKTGSFSSVISQN